MLGIYAVRSIISLPNLPQAALHLLNQVAPYLESAVWHFRGLFSFILAKKSCATQSLCVLMWCCQEPVPMDCLSQQFPPPPPEERKQHNSSYK